ncbi:PAS-domain containing protein [Sulfitobacter sediminilitoris]|uniref:PAS-domain containing protein n=1 Tax=Sulfitobacter sediminilitoris TaxID=2698830 RepID=UPI00361F7712
MSNAIVWSVGGLRHIVGDWENIASDTLDMIDVGLGVFDQNYRLIYANAPFRDLRGYSNDLCSVGVSLEALLEHSALRGDFGPGDPNALVQARLDEIAAATDRFVEHVRPDGQALQIRYQRRDDGGLTITYRDQTAEKHAQQALALSEERYSLVSQAADEAIYDWEVGTEHFFASPRLDELLGHEISGSTKPMEAWRELVHPDDLDRYVENIRCHFKDESNALEQEYRVRTRDGDFHWVHDRGAVVRDEAGHVLRLVGAVRDVTEIRAAEANLAATQRRLVSSLSSLSDGILMVDAERRVELFNQRYVEIFSAAAGQDASSIIWVGRNFFDMIRDGYDMGMFEPHPDGADAWIENRLKAWENPMSQWELELANGSWILLNERELPDGGRISIYTDVTEIKRREAEADAARQRFEEAIEAISSGFALWDAQDRLVISNTRFRAYFSDIADIVVPGNTFSEIISAGIERGLFPAAAGDVDGYLEKIAEKRLRADATVREQFVNNLWLQITDHRTQDGGIVSIYTDVTELKERQEEVARQSALLQLTLENMGQGISLVDKDLRTMAFNQKFLELMGFPANDFQPGFTMEQAFRWNAERGEYGPGDIDQQVAERLELAAKFQAHQFQRTKPDGTVLEIVGIPIDGGGMVSTYTDITERKAAEDGMRAALDEFNAVSEHIDYGILFTGSDLRARIVNKAFRDLWGMDQAFIDTAPHMRDVIEFNKNTGLYGITKDQWDTWLTGRLAAIEAGAVPPTEIVRGTARCSPTKWLHCRMADG